MEIYNVKTPYFLLSGVTSETCPNKKSFWIWVIYAPEGYMGGSLIFGLKKVFFWNTLLGTLLVHLGTLPDHNMVHMGTLPVVIKWSSSGQ